MELGGRQVNREHKGMKLQNTPLTPCKQCKTPFGKLSKWNCYCPRCARMLQRRTEWEKQAI